MPTQLRPQGVDDVVEIARTFRLILGRAADMASAASEQASMAAPVSAEARAVLPCYIALRPGQPPCTRKLRMYSSSASDLGSPGISFSQCW
jgi:hypothetical protein